MKHEKIQPSPSDVPIPGLSDEGIEARVFRNLAAKQKALQEEQDSAVVILQYPDNRSLYQRLVAWWYLRKRSAQPVVADIAEDGFEPVWRGHWATVKYL